MKIFYKGIWIYLIILVLISSYSPMLGLLIFCILFQLGTIVEVFKQVKLFKKVKNGPFAVGNLIDFRKIRGNEEDEHNYEGTIRFYEPNANEYYQIKFKFSSLVKPSIGKEYKIWINNENPQNSISLEQFNNQKSSLFFLSIIILGLFIVDYVLVMRIG